MAKHSALGSQVFDNRLSGGFCVFTRIVFIFGLDRHTEGHAHLGGLIPVGSLVIKVKEIKRNKTCQTLIGLSRFDHSLLQRSESDAMRHHNA